MLVRMRFGELNSHVHIVSGFAALCLRPDKCRDERNDAEQYAPQMVVPLRHCQNLYPAATPITSLAAVAPSTGEDSIRLYSREKSR